jgi:activator of 2-hydroxyglutaryl-CoA dehydratase
MAKQHKANSLFVGIDWGSQTHQVCVMDAERVVLLDAAFPHSGTGLADMLAAVMRAAEETQRDSW